MKNKKSILKAEFEGKKISVEKKEIVLSKDMTEKNIKKVLAHDLKNQQYFYFVDKVEKPAETDDEKETK